MSTVEVTEEMLAEWEALVDRWELTKGDGYDYSEYDEAEYALEKAGLTAVPLLIKALREARAKVQRLSGGVPSLVIMQDERDAAIARAEKAERERGLAERDRDNALDAARLESAQAAAMREALQNGRDNLVPYVNESKGVDHLRRRGESSLREMHAALASDAGRLLLERVRRLAELARRLASATASAEPEHASWVPSIRGELLVAIAELEGK